jgi:hypothetical protein
MAGLRDRGWDVDPSVTTIDRAVEEILKITDSREDSC